MHPVPGVPQMYHEQLNVVACHLQDIKWDCQLQQQINGSGAILPSVAKLNRHNLKQADDWTQWQAAKFKQLDQYEQQNTFGPPCELPPDANVLNLIWTYVFKEHENRRKARCVCNAETYTSTLEQSGSQIFWAVSALKNLIVIGADASNSFAKAPPPKAPLYVYLDTQFREWWESKG